ncbi:MAG: RIP metalloprotease RseP [Bacteroidaceae bacterium]|nr:RIP metalloprotease RseP [Bacteroidaceae bacterium]MBP9637299.1 RIP metalloprotease RseP [Bacteroidaceae bacterium]
METFLIKALQLILSLSLLVLIHEGGHFLFARLFKVRVEKFYIFFNPWFSLFKHRFKHKQPDGSIKEGETEYGLGWLPLGGYCKIAGMIDESMDTEQMAQPEQPWEFRSKPAWQRLLIMVGGVLFNFILALIIYAAILFSWGESYIKPQDYKFGMEFGEVAHGIGFKDGDILLKADKQDLSYDGYLRQIADAREVTVQRGSTQAVVYMPEDLMPQLMAAKEHFATPILPYVIDSIVPGRGLAKANFQRGDSIIAVNGHIVHSFNAYGTYMASLKENKGSRDINLTYVRKGITDTTLVRLDSAYLGGAYPFMADRYFRVCTKEYGALEAIPAGIQLGVKTLSGYVGDMKYVFTKEGANSLGGFGTIGSIFPATWNWYAFWQMTAFLSIILAFMNILPIPALDGGHVLFLIYEIVARRKPSDKFLERAQMVGMFLLFGLLIWANFNDLLRMVFGVNL